MNQRVGKYLVNLSLVSLLLFLNVRESREQDLVSGLLGSLLANGVTSLGSEFMHLKPSAENDGGQQQQQPGHSSGIMGWFSHLPGLQAFSNSGGIFSMMMNKMKSLFGGQKGSAGSDSSSVGGILSESVANSIVHDFQRLLPDPWMDAYSQLSTEARHCLIKASTAHWYDESSSMNSLTERMEEDGCDGDGSATALLQQLHQDFESLPSNFRKISKEAFFAMKENGLTPGLAKKLRSQLSGLSNDDKRQVVDAFPKLEFLFSGPYPKVLSKDLQRLAEGKISGLEGKLEILNHFDKYSKSAEYSTTGPHKGLSRAAKEDLPFAMSQILQQQSSAAKPNDDK